MKITPSILVCIFFAPWVFGQPGDVPPMAEPGKCYAKCQILSAPEEVTQTYPVYIGSNPESRGLKTITIIHEEAHFEWVEKKNIVGQTLRCLIEVPELTEDLVILKDTMGRSDYILETFTFYRYAHRRYLTEWREVICNDRITEHLVNTIQQELMDKGFYRGGLTGRVDKTTKAALVQYQKYTYLPIGNLDTTTLDSLEIFYH